MAVGAKHVDFETENVRISKPSQLFQPNLCVPFEVFIERFLTHGLQNTVTD
jgi:hypothetical protein